jgi:hypothetical protein
MLRWLPVHLLQPAGRAKLLIAHSSQTADSQGWRYPDRVMGGVGAPPRQGHGFGVHPQRHGPGHGGPLGRGSLGHGAAGRGGRFPPQPRFQQYGEVPTASQETMPQAATVDGMSWMPRDAERRQSATAPQVTL